MKLGPLTFQCACLHWVWRSMQSASRRLSKSATRARASAGISFLVEKSWPVSVPLLPRELCCRLGGAAVFEIMESTPAGYGQDHMVAARNATICDSDRVGAA